MAATAQAMDFTNVKDAGQFNPKRVPEGPYKAKILKVEDHTSGNAKAANNWVFTIQLTAANRSRGTYPYYCGFDEKQAWKIRNLLIAAGMAVPKKKVKVDPNKLVGKTIGVEMEDDEYEGKKKSVITATFPADELDSDSPAGGGSSDDDDADDTATDGEEEELDLEEL
jgi:hypothetical protein